MSPKRKLVGPAPEQMFPGLTPGQIGEQMERILISRDFTATKAQRSFFRFVVEKALAGETDEIKGYTVATQVFGRDQDFDQATDPIVSIQANKLRRALERYYLTSGSRDPIWIEIPKGAYVPLIKAQEPAEPAESGPLSEAETHSRAENWPTVLVRPFRNLTGDLEQDRIIAGLVNELSIELGRYQDLRVCLDPTDGGDPRAAAIPARFVVNGWVSWDSETIKVMVSLIDTQSQTHIWGDSYKSKLNPATIIAFQEEAAQIISAKIASEWGIISQTMSQEVRTQDP